MILEHGIGFQHADESDFELELAFERRVEDYASPRSRRRLDTCSIRAVATPKGPLNEKERLGRSSQSSVSSRNELVR